ncbi:hypothetical protein DFJ74DRAFT_653558 [Hyaloraphidium curvatum]|nr:hypothetical protein DFJ74DRAFT_653558 [Hyaloraphidium curvatum]
MALDPAVEPAQVGRPNVIGGAAPARSTPSSAPAGLRQHIRGPAASQRAYPSLWVSPARVNCANPRRARISRWKTYSRRFCDRGCITVIGLMHGRRATCGRDEHSERCSIAYLVWAFRSASTTPRPCRFPWRLFCAPWKCFPRIRTLRITVLELLYSGHRRARAFAAWIELSKGPRRARRQSRGMSPLRRLSKSCSKRSQGSLSMSCCCQWARLQRARPRSPF